MFAAFWSANQIVQKGSRMESKKRRPKRLGLWMFSMLVAAAMFASTASSASALTLGLNWAGNNSEMYEVGKSGAGMFRIEMGMATPHDPDAAVRSAAENGVTIEGIFGGAVNGEPTELPKEGAPRTAFIQTVEAEVARYGYGGSFWTSPSAPPYHPITVWEVWNEPNLSGIPAAEYGHFLNQVASAIQRVSKETAGRTTEVLSGGLLAFGYKEEEKGGNRYAAALAYLRESYPYFGGTGKVTGIGIHPYEVRRPTASKMTAFEHSVEGFHEELVSLAGELGAAQLPLWITETGYALEKGTGEPAGFEVIPVTSAQQASLLRETVTFVETHASPASLNLQGLFWYNVSDFEGAHWDAHCGLRTASGGYRPAWFDFQELMGAPEWPQPVWNTENLGGVTESAPAISSWGPGRADLWARGTDNSLDHRSWEPSTGWTTWEQIGVGKVLTSAPSAVNVNSNRIDVVGRLSDGSVAHWSWDRSIGWAGENLGGVTESAPAISGVPGSTLTDFEAWARGNDNSLDHRSWTPSTGWGVWQRVPGGTEITSAPGALTVSGRHDVVARSTDGSVEHWYWVSGVGWQADNLGGNIVGSPTITSWGSGRYDVFARGTDNSLDHTWWTPSTGWSAWERIPGPEITSSPSAVSWGYGRVDIVATVAGGSIEHWSFELNPR